MSTGGVEGHIPLEVPGLEGVSYQQTGQMTGDTGVYGIYSVFKDDQLIGQLTMTRQPEGALTQAELDTLDSGFPIIRYVPFNEAGDAAKTTDSEVFQTLSSEKAGFNVWLSPSLGITVSINMLEMVNMLKQNRLSELNARIASMLMFLAVADSMSEAVKESAELQAEIHEMNAMMGIYTMVAGITQAGMTLGFGLGGMIPGPAGELNQSLSGMSQGVSQAISGGGQAMTEFIIASLTRAKGMWDSYKEALDGLKEVIRTNLQSSIEADRENAELLKSTLEKLLQIYHQQSQAHGFSTTGQQG